MASWLSGKSKINTRNKNKIKGLAYILIGQTLVLVLFSERLNQPNAFSKYTLIPWLFVEQSICCPCSMFPRGSTRSEGQQNDCSPLSYGAGACILLNDSTQSHRYVTNVHVSYFSVVCIAFLLNAVYILHFEQI